MCLHVSILPTVQIQITINAHIYRCKRGVAVIQMVQQAIYQSEGWWIDSQFSIGESRYG